MLVAGQMIGRYKGRPSGKTIARDFPFIVEIAVPPGGLGRRLNDMQCLSQSARHSGGARPAQTRRRS